jgi:hypothetical protein
MANQIKVDVGTIDGETDIYQVRVVDGIININYFNIEKIQRGYGSTPQEATEDFIRRNKSEVLDQIFKQEK